jgi:hypothetical protein
MAELAIKKLGIFLEDEPEENNIKVEVPQLSIQEASILKDIDTPTLFRIIRDQRYHMHQLKLTWSAESEENLDDVLQWLPGRIPIGQADKDLGEMLFSKATALDILIECVLRIGTLKNILGSTLALSEIDVVGFTEICTILCREFALMCIGNQDLSVKICLLLGKSLDLGTNLLFEKVDFAEKDAMNKFHDAAKQTEQHDQKRKILERVLSTYQRKKHR